MKNSKDIIKGMDSYLTKFLNPISIFTFGFGEEHDVNMLRFVHFFI